MTKNLKSSIKDIKTSITNLEEKMCSIDTNMAKLSAASNHAAASTPLSYTSILAHASATPQFTDPRIQAREGIRHQQVKIELKDPKTPLLSLNDRSLIEKFNQALDNNRKILHLICNLKLNTLIIETTANEAATWLRTNTNIKSLLFKLDLKGAYLLCSYSVIANFVPITFNSDSETQRAKFFETNNINPSKVSDMRWIKPVECRHTCQTSAHLMLTLVDTNTANHLILHGA